MNAIRFYLTLGLMLGLGAKVSAQNYKALDSLLTTLDTARKFNGNVLITEKNKVVYSRSTGFAQLKSGKKNSPGSAFQIGSVSKIITATAALQLSEQGKISLDDPLGKFLADFPYKELTIRHLLGHTSGLPDKEELFFPFIDADSNYLATNDSIIPALKKYNKPLAFSPGSQWRYNNIGFALLALIIEKASGQSFPNYLQQHIFVPSGMKNSYLLVSRPQDSSQVSGYTVRHHYLDDLEPISVSKKARRWNYNLRLLYGPTNVISTAADLARFARALQSHKLLNKATSATAFAPTRLNSGNPVDAGGEFGPSSYGLGWFLPKVQGTDNTAMHTGREPGFFTFFWYDPDHQRSIILLDNTESTGFGLACKQALNSAYAKELFKKEAELRKSLFKPYVHKLLSGGPDQAAALFNRLKSDTLQYFTDERELNELGLELLEDHHDVAALEALKLNTMLYPKSWNAYDSYGKALLQTGKTQEAIEMYRLSVKMFPGNLPGRKILEQLTKE